MNMQQIECQEHGGTFERLSQRGRPPRVCPDDNPCTGVRKARQVRSNARKTSQVAPKASGGRRPGKVAQTTAERVSSKTGVPVKAVRGSQTVATPAVVKNNPSVPIARELREQLEPLGWTCHARGFFDSQVGMVDFSATRDSEMITIMITDGKITSQRYSIWNDERPAANGAPAARLTFDPDELSDVELIRKLAGKKVIWWNTLGKNREVGILPKTDQKKISVQHCITMTEGEPDELPGSRVITFVDQAVDSQGNPVGTGFRSFKVGSLLAVR